MRKQGFKQADLVGLVANVQDHIDQNFKLELGSVSESVTVEAADNNINTTDASVGTVIDRQFVENIPMNGRSFRTLVLLSPGVVTNNPNGSDSGEYSVNVQRTDANGFYVDGVSASNTVSVASSGGNSGMLPSVTALGTTQAMLQVDAMEEFRISTSSYFAEFGNHPGAQISFRSRSGAIPGTEQPLITSVTPPLTPIIGSTPTARLLPRHRQNTRTTLAVRSADRSRFRMCIRGATAPSFSSLMRDCVSIHLRPLISTTFLPMERTSKTIRIIQRIPSGQTSACMPLRERRRF